MSSCIKRKREANKEKNVPFSTAYSSFINRCSAVGTFTQTMVSLVPCCSAAPPPLHNIHESETHSVFWHVYFSFIPSFQHKGTSSTSTTIPVIKSLICRVPSSVEGINHELENVFIREDWEQGMQVGSAVFQHDLLVELRACSCCEILFTSRLKCQIISHRL